MAYCPNCGAYIPEGQTVCVACGTNMNAVPQNPVAVEQTAEKANEKKTMSTSERTGETPTAQKPAEGFENMKSTSGNKALAVLSYLGLLCILPFIIAKDDEFAVYHARQGALLLIIDVVAGFLFNTSSGIGSIISIAILVFIVIGIKNACNGEMKPLPYIGKYAEKK